MVARRKETPQKPWYELACKYIEDCTVIDIGAGDGQGVEIMLRSKASYVVGIDPISYPPYVIKGRGEDLPINSYDWATCMDVIEHMPNREKAAEFFNHIIKVPRIALFLTTPNFNTSHAQNEAHPFEFKPDELEELLTGLDYDIWNYNHAIPPFSVDSLDKCQTFGIIIWKTRGKKEVNQDEENH